jgi:hypothetical protein
MSLETIAFLLGGFLLTVGLFGGGLEIKELKLPQINGVARIASVVAGFGFITLALAINLEWMKHGEAVSTTKKFDVPMFEGLRLDACVEWSKRCGEEAATTWCKEQGYDRATVYPFENVGERGIPTKLIGTKDVCKQKFCTSFSQITCVK